MRRSCASSTTAQHTDADVDRCVDEFARLVRPDGSAGRGKPVVSADAVAAVRAVVMPRLAEALGVGEDLVTDDLELATLGLSSLEVMELVYDAEDELDIVVDEDSLADVTTVGGLLVALADTDDVRRPRDRPQSRHLSELLEARAPEFGAKSVFRFLDSGADWSFVDLERRARGSRPARTRVVPGERVGILAEDRAVFCDAFFGAHARGVVPVPLGVAGRSVPTRGGAVVRDRVGRFGLAALAHRPGRGRRPRRPRSRRRR